VNATKTAGTTRRHPWLAFTAGAVAVSALAGAVALTAGLNMGATITDRIPFHSTLFGGLALVLVVALPMAVAAYLAGALLIGWIAIQVLIIRPFSWLQPAMALLARSSSSPDGYNDPGVNDEPPKDQERDEHRRDDRARGHHVQGRRPSARTA
jgi:hypothetical protein